MRELEEKSRTTLIDYRIAPSDSRLSLLEVIVNTADATIQALDLESRFRISFWDALILQAAETAGAAVVYSEDLSNGQKFGSVRVENPLVE